MSIFILTIKVYPGIFPNRVDTWKSRIALVNKENTSENYQIEKAKIAIATWLRGLGPGKSVQKNFTTIFIRFGFCNYYRRIWINWGIISFNSLCIISS